MAMNLGSANLKHVNTSRPQLAHSNSQRSISASDDYYSLSENSADGSIGNDSDERATVIRYQTPPSRTASVAAAEADALADQDRTVTLAQLRAEEAQSHPHLRNQTSAEYRQELAGRYPDSQSGSEEYLREREEELEQSQRGIFPAPLQPRTPSQTVQPSWQPSPPGAYPEYEPYRGAPSPLDSLPGDRLVRDAQPALSYISTHENTPVASPARQSSPPPPIPPKDPTRPSTAQSYRQPSERPQSSDSIVRLPTVESRSNVRFTPTAITQGKEAPDMRSWHASKSGVSPPTPGLDDTPYIQFAIDQLTRDEEALGRSRDPRGSVDGNALPSGYGVAVSDDRPVSPLSETEEVAQPLNGQTSRRGPIPSYRPDSEIARSPEPVVLPQRVSNVSQWSDEHIGNLETDHMLKPAQPPTDRYRYPPLTYVPLSLRLPGIGLLVLFGLVLIALLVASMVYSNQTSGLWNYDGLGTARYFLAQYLPPFFAVLFLISLFIIQAAVQRVLPFALMSAQSNTPRDDVIGTVPVYIRNYLLPNVSLMRKGELRLTYFSISAWLALFSVPLASSLYAPRYYASQVTETATNPWAYQTAQPVAIILIGIYANLVISLVLLYLRFRSSPTGLKWDPSSLADILVLMRRSANPTQSFSRPHSGGAQHREIDPFTHRRPVSIGYWESPSHPGTFFHGIGAAGSTTRLHLEGGKAVARTSDESSANQQTMGPQGAIPQASTFESWASTKPTSPHPRFLRPGWLVFMAVIPVVLLIAFLLVSYINSPLSRGFLPRLPSADASTATYSSFSPANFLYSFVPALIAMFLPLLWTPVDTTARFLAPFVSIARSGNRGIAAEKSLLISYPANGSFMVIPKAVANGHWVVAATALLGLVNWAVVITAGGVFSAVFDTSRGDVVVRAEQGGMGVLTGLLVVVALGWIAVWPVSRGALGGGGKGRRARRSRHGRGGVVAKATGLMGRKKGLSEKDAEKGAVKDDGTFVAESWLGESDVRVLSGIREVVGEGILGLRVWREPRSRVDLVGRLVGRGRGRWSWSSEKGGVERVGASEIRM